MSHNLKGSAGIKLSCCITEWEREWSTNSSWKGVYSWYFSGKGHKFSFGASMAESEYLHKQNRDSNSALDPLV